MQIITGSFGDHVIVSISKMQALSAVAAHAAVDNAPTLRKVLPVEFAWPAIKGA